MNNLQNLDIRNNNAEKSKFIANVAKCFKLFIQYGKELHMRNKNILLVALIIIFFVSANPLLAQNGKVTWSSFNMGYAEPKSNNTMLKSVVGQVFIGTTQQSNLQVISGFLADTLFRSTIVDVKNQEQLPTSYSLWQNYPNPFNPSTTIHFEIPKETHITLKVYNMLGQEVLIVLDEKRSPGRYNIRIDASSLASGVYFYRFVSEDFSSTKKLILVR